MSSGGAAISSPRRDAPKRKELAPAVLSAWAASTEASGMSGTSAPPQVSKSAYYAGDGSHRAEGSRVSCNGLIGLEFSDHAAPRSGWLAAVGAGYPVPRAD